jgi:hypothetical protein
VSTLDTDKKKLTDNENEVDGEAPADEEEDMDEDEVRRRHVLARFVRSLFLGG